MQIISPSRLNEAYKDMVYEGIGGQLQHQNTLINFENDKVNQSGFGMKKDSFESIELDLE